MTDPTSQEVKGAYRDATGEVRVVTITVGETETPASVKERFDAAMLAMMQQYPPSWWNN